MTETFYDVLGVASDATTEEIRAAYRARLKESHPDLNDDEDAGAATKRIIRARDVLTDEAERERYDRVGHAAYVGRTDAGVDDGAVSSAAAAARRAGWATSDSDQSTGSSTETGAGRDRERRRRDRAARERAARERADATESTRGDTEGASDGATQAGATANGSATNGSTTGTAGTEADGATGGATESAWSWNADEGYSVRQRRARGNRRRPLFAASQSLPLLALAFVLYPVMLFSAVFPPFPLVVNVVVGLCTVFLVGYLQSIPEVAVFVFGAWSLATPIALAIAGVGLTSLVGVVALAATWLPLGLSVLTFTLVR